jgi:hypothetical protein
VEDLEGGGWEMVDDGVWNVAFEIVWGRHCLCRKCKSCYVVRGG